MLEFRKILLIIPDHYKGQLPSIALLMIIGAGFEVLGVSFIIPLLDIIAGNTDSDIIYYLSPFFPNFDNQALILSCVVVFAIIYLIKGFYLSYLAWRIGLFTYNVKAEISDGLMKRYLSAGYEYHLQNNSSQLIRNLTTESDQLVAHVLNPLLTIVTEGVVIIAVIFFLLVIEPIGTLTVVVMLILLSSLFQRFIGQYSSKLGKVRQDADGNVIKQSQEALGGIKDLKVTGREKTFFKQFSRFNRESAVVSAKQYAVGQFPRMYLETIAVLTLSALLLVLIQNDEGFLESIPVLGVFALAAFRLLPSANRILSSLNSLRFADPVVSTLEEQLQLTIDCEHHIDAHPTDNVTTFNNCIEVTNLCYQYPSSYQVALEDITLCIRKGESIGIMGKSGAGKSTLLDALLGLLTPTSGVIKVDGSAIYENIRGWQHLVGYVPQDIFLLDASIRRNIAFGISDEDIDEERLEKVISEASIVEFTSNLSDGLETRLGERGVRLSGGQKQRIGIARALYRDAPILVFDEATSALDTETEHEMVTAIKNLKGTKTILVIAHRLSTIEHCDRVIELNEGSILKIHENGFKK